MNPKTIFDVGMNNGDDTAYYLHKGYNVVSVEANPYLVEKVKPRFRDELKNGRLTILNFGIADVEGTVPFWICEAHSEWSSFHREIASRDNSAHHEILIPTRRFDSIIEEFGAPYYLKVDIEGNDGLCMNGLKKGSLPDFLSVETSDLSQIDLMAELGYTRFKTISQYHYLPLEQPPSRQQIRYEQAQRRLAKLTPLLRIIRKLGGQKWIERLKNPTRVEGDWFFPFGSSGPFGDGLPGRWQSHSEMRATFETFQKMMHRGESSPFWTDKNYSFWADFHAAK